MQKLQLLVLSRKKEMEGASTFAKGNDSGT
jgi:hypothetical protein